MKQYLDFLRHIQKEGIGKSDRTGTGTCSIFGYQMRFNLQDGFPIVTTKNTHFKSVVHELLWFVQGNTNTKYLRDNGVRIWDEWADENGELGPVYGKQWRRWETPDGREIDQLSDVIEQIKTNPNSRRIIVSAWNVSDLGKMALPPCHAMFQFYVTQGRLSCMLTQRSADAFLGVPFNISSYALLTHMVAQQCNLKVGEFIWSGGDCHIYSNHFEQIATQLERKPFPLPKLKLKKAKSLFEYRYEDFELINYQHHPSIKAPIAI